MPGPRRFILLESVVQSTTLMIFKHNFAFSCFLEIWVMFAQGWFDDLCTNSSAAQLILLFCMWCISMRNWYFSTTEMRENFIFLFISAREIEAFTARFEFNHTQPPIQSQRNIFLKFNATSLHEINYEKVALSSNFTKKYSNFVKRSLC